MSLFLLDESDYTRHKVRSVSRFEYPSLTLVIRIYISDVSTKPATAVTYEYADHVMHRSYEALCTIFPNTKRLAFPHKKIIFSYYHYTTDRLLFYSYSTQQQPVFTMETQRLFFWYQGMTEFINII